MIRVSVRRGLNERKTRQKRRGCFCCTLSVVQVEESYLGLCKTSKKPITTIVRVLNLHIVGTETRCQTNEILCKCMLICAYCTWSTWRSSQSFKQLAFYFILLKLVSFYIFLICRYLMKKKKYTVQKMKFSIKDFFSKCDQIRSFLRIWWHLLKKC